MGTVPQPSPDQSQGAAPPAGGGGSAPDQGSQPTASPSQSPTNAPASQMQLLLNRWYQAAKQMAAADPRLASGANKVAEGIQEMQTSLVTPPQPTPMGQQPQY